MTDANRDATHSPGPQYTVKVTPGHHFDWRVQILKGGTLIHEFSQDGGKREARMDAGIWIQHDRTRLKKERAPMLESVRALESW